MPTTMDTPIYTAVKCQTTKKRDTSAVTTMTTTTTAMALTTTNSSTKDNQCLKSTQAPRLPPKNKGLKIPHR